MLATTRADRAVGVALNEYKRHIEEPPGHNWEEIDKYIRSPRGLDWSSADENNLGEPIPYTRNRQFKWCGAFQAWVWGRVGLKHAIRKSSMASLYRLHRFARGTARLIEPDKIRRGDVLLTGPLEGGHEWGAHMAMATDPPRDGWVSTIEGNAFGMGIDGRHYEGVVKQRRPLATNPQDGEEYHVLYGVRFLPQDFER